MATTSSVQFPLPSPITRIPATNAIAAVAVLLLLIAFLFLSLSLVFPSSAHGATGWVTYRFTNNDVPDVAQDIADGYIYWTHFDGHDFELYERQLSEARVTQITDNEWGDGDASMDMGVLAWREIHPLEGDRYSSQIMVRRVSSGEQWALTAGPYSCHALPVSRAGRVCWQGHDGPGHWEIFHFDIATREVTQITHNSVPDVGPSYDGGVIVYRTLVDVPGGTRIWATMVYDLGSRTSRPLSGVFMKTDEAEPVVSDRTVAFQRWDGQDWEVWIHNLDSGLQTQITANSRDDHVCGLDGRYLLFVEHMPAPPESYGASRLHLWDIQTLTEVWASPDWYYFVDAQLTWSTVAWTGAESLTADTEVYVYRHSLAELTRLTDNDYDDYGVRTDGHRVLWTGQVGGTPRGFEWSLDEVFMAVPFAIPEIPFFSDVMPIHHYFRPIEELRRLGVLGGYEYNLSWEFRPEAPAWRAQFAKMICETLGLTVPLDIACPFQDLGEDDPQDRYPHQYVAVAAANGITQGTGGGNFSPYVNIGRAQLVTMIVRAAQRLAPQSLTSPPAGFTGTLGRFDPVHGPTMAVAEHNGLMKDVVGFGPGWDPWASATRGEMAAMLWVLRGLVK